MLGLRSNPHGQEGFPFKNGNKEPVASEILLTPKSAKPNPIDDHYESRDMVSQERLMMSPALSAAPKRTGLRQSTSSYGRPMGMIRASIGRFTSAFVREQHAIVRQKAHRELGAGVSSRAFDTSYEELLQWIKSERLTRLPHKGGSWDRVLIAAQYFADQVHHLNYHIQSFTDESNAATKFVFGQCILLLELGHENAEALEKAFSLFYQFGLELSPLIRRADVFHESQSIMEDLGRAFADLLQIVTGVSISFYQAVHTCHSSVRLDIFSTFRSLIESFRSRIHHCAHEMWDVTLPENIADNRSVDVLQRWLAPQDNVLYFLSSNHVNLTSQAEQFTCTWFQSQLSSFLKGNESILLVEGAPSSGKTVLANWVVDRLQRPIGRKHVSTISFFFNYSVLAQATPLAMLKTLLYQLLSLRIGDLDLFNAVAEVYDQSKTLLSAEEQEDKMWHTISKALSAINEDMDGTLAIVIDGVFEIDAHRAAAQHTCKKLHELAQKHAAVRLIQFFRPLEMSPISSVRVKLSAENILEDLGTVIRRRISLLQHFNDRELGDQERIVELLVEASGNSMLLASLTCDLLQLQSSCKEFDTVLKTVVAESKTITEAVRRLIVALKLDTHAKSLLSLLIATERPLQMGELEALFRAEPEHYVLKDKPVDVRLLVDSISAFAIVGEGLITLRHNAIKQALIAISDEPHVMLNLKERHKDFAIRLLIYAKSCLHGEHEPTLTYLEMSQVRSRLQAHRLFEYAVRYWTVHFKKSSLYKGQGDLQLPKEFKKLFSGSVMFCMLEQACWNYQIFAHEALVLHTTAFRVRKAIFGQDHACVLQSALSCALLCDNLLSRPSEAIEWYALAAKISRVVVGFQADVTIACCTALLRISATYVSKKRTVIMTYREEILLILIESHKHRYGSSSKEVLEVYQKLLELYTYIEEEEKSAEIVAVIQKITIALYGSHSDQAALISRKAEVLLKKHEQIGEVEVYGGLLFGGYQAESEESFTLLRVEIIINLAAEYVARGEFEMAEELYIELWMKLTDYCHSVHICEWHEKKIQLMLIYARFLEKRKRVSEASAVLIAVWTEYEHHEFSMMESILILLKDIAVSMKICGLLTIALTVFQKCWSAFKHQHKEKTTIYKEIEEYISHTSTEIVKTAISHETTTTSETIIREVFESSVSTSETTVTTTSVELCKSLTKIYLKEERWSDASSCIRKLLTKSWASFFSESIEDITMTESFRAESIELVMQLAHCYISQKRYEKAEDIYVRLYRVHRKSYKLDDVHVVKYCELLLGFYSTHELFTKSISFYQELLVEYRAFYGASHLMTIKILYALGDLCRRHHINYGYWLEYYLEIVTALNGEKAVICHEEAFRALVLVAEHYYETLRFSESIGYFKCIFATFRKHGTKYKYFEKATEVQILIEHYFRALEETKVEIHSHMSILKELREACMKYYGEASVITLSVTVTIAEVCCRSEQYEFEAISFYEHIVKHSSMVSEKIVRKSQSTLKTLYVKQITSTSKETIITKETMERATTLLLERYLEIRKTHSCTHEISLSHFKELIMLYHKQSKQELALKELKSLIVECITKVTLAKELIETAKFFAALYISCGLATHGFEIISELKSQVIYKSTQRCAHFGFDVTKIGRSCFAFIAAFECHLRAEYSRTFSMYMADLVAEALFYERFVQYLKIKSKIEKVFVIGGRLRQILVRSRRVEIFNIIEQKTLEYFCQHETEVVKSSTKASVRTFVTVLLTYFSSHTISKSWTAVAGYAAVEHLRILLKEQKNREALELAACTFKFLMQHQGLDDPTEITLGFQLCLMMAGRTQYNQKCSDAVVYAGTIDLSRQILSEVLDICKNFKLNIAQCQLSELNELVGMVGEQKDYGRLVWLLNTLWSSREGQSTWPQETILYLGKRLVEAQFAAGNYTVAIRLCEDIVYNVRRVHGPRHHYTLQFHRLLASMYTSLAIKHRDEATAEKAKNRKHAEEMARLYFKKAISVHEEVLKLIIGQDDVDTSDCDDDDMTDYNDGTVSHNGTTINGYGNATQTVQGSGIAWASRAQELEYVRTHIRRLQLAVQRFGGWHKHASEYDRLTTKLWSSYGKELNLSQEQCLASKWKINGFAFGKAEGDRKEDGFRAPEVWWIVKS